MLTGYNHKGVDNMQTAKVENVDVADYKYQEACSIIVNDIHELLNDKADEMLNSNYFRDRIVGAKLSTLAGWLLQEHGQCESYRTELYDLREKVDDIKRFLDGVDGLEELEIIMDEIVDGAMGRLQ